MLSPLCLGNVTPPEGDTHKCLTQIRPASLAASMALHAEESEDPTNRVTVKVKIGKSEKNSKCVPSPEQGTACSPDAGEMGNRINTDHQTATDSFLISSKDGNICATRQDNDGGWGMNLELRCGVEKTTAQFLLRSQLTGKCLNVQKINSQTLAAVVPCSEESKDTNSLKWTLKQKPMVSEPKETTTKQEARQHQKTKRRTYWVLFYLETEFDGHRLCLDARSWTVHENPWGTMQVKACQDLIDTSERSDSHLLCHHNKQNGEFLQVYDLDECDLKKDIAFEWGSKGLASSHEMPLGLTNWDCEDCFAWNPKVTLWKLE